MADRGRTIWILHAAPKSRERYGAALGRHHHLRFFRSGRVLRACLSSNRPTPDLLIADLRPNGETILDLLRSRSLGGPRCALIVVSWIDDLDLVRECFAHGATEYLSAPFHTAELRVKVERILRCAVEEGPEEPSDDLSLDPRTLTVRLGCRCSDGLTAKEFQILSSLVVTPGRTAARSDIIRQVWREARVEPKTLDVHLSHLRRKVEGLGLSIHKAGIGRLALSVGTPDLRAAS